MKKWRKLHATLLANWRAKLVCLLIGFLIWFAVKTYQNIPQGRKFDLDRMNQASQTTESWNL